ncbi:hypothetical protein O6H91_03G135200 [Diphasiastrum complanatum]|uniref:Uncharacterized protein n=2 Tax=Diphasiastrum complanatum TaxID=34168 RepID=A0ACC2EBQ6_DIPCM|nr:hypothetical protein O6H91_03G135200 [Diphasiastrum complanatum]KAJ7564064.1 hypothetical protein O6H91_03G135200 [Diphasiastrum complanatum]
MARQSVAAMDFLGVEKGPETNGSSQNERSGSTLVRPTPSLPSFKDPTPWSHSLSAGSAAAAAAAAGAGVGAGSSPLSSPQAAVFLKGRGWAMAEGKEGSVAAPPQASPAPPQKQSGGADRQALDKPLEELTDADIMQLTREDCRRYLKERGMRRPSWNKFQAIQQVLSLKGLFDSKPPGERDIQKEDSPPKDCDEVASDAMLPILKAESNGHNVQGITGGAKEVHSFFGSAKEGFGLVASVQKKGIFADGQCQLPQIMDEKHGSPCPPDSSSSLLNPDLTLSLPSAWEKGPLPSNLGGFGSPLPVFLTSKERPGSPFATVQITAARNVQGRSPSQGMQTSNELGSRHSSAHARPSTAQLTIFYAGLVNVYDEVPADKAQAIMLLAGSGNQWAASSGMRPPAAIDYPVSAPIVATSPSVPASSGAGDHCKEGMPPPVPAAIFNPAPINQQCVRRPHSELPQARKASLQRFLEKRKERALANAPYIVKKAETEDSSPLWDRACDMSPCSSKAMEAGSASPVPLPQHSLSGAHANRPSKSCGSENSSPSRVPRVEEIVLNSQEKGCAGVEVEKQYEKSETVNSADEKMIETEEDAASSQV